MPRNNMTEWYVQLINGRTGRPISDDLVCNVLTDGDPAEITIYSDDDSTSLSNPIVTTATNGIIRFFTANSVTSVDLSILTDDGYAFFIESLTPSQHRLVVWPETEGHVLVVPYDVAGTTEALQDTGFNIPANVLVKDVFLHTTTLATSGALDIGVSGDTDGFLDAVTAAATGFKALSEVYASGGIIGALIAAASGSTTRVLYRAATATSLVYLNTTAASAAGAGYIYLTLIRVPTGA